MTLYTTDAGARWRNMAIIGEGVCSVRLSQRGFCKRRNLMCKVQLLRSLLWRTSQLKTCSARAAQSDSPWLRAAFVSEILLDSTRIGDVPSS